MNSPTATILEGSNDMHAGMGTGRKRAADIKTPLNEDESEGSHKKAKLEARALPRQIEEYCRETPGFNQQLDKLFSEPPSCSESCADSDDHSNDLSRKLKNVTTPSAKAHTVSMESKETVCCCTSCERLIQQVEVEIAHWRHQICHSERADETHGRSSASSATENTVQTPTTNDPDSGGNHPDDSAKVAALKRENRELGLQLAAKDKECRVLGGQLADITNKELHLVSNVEGGEVLKAFNMLKNGVHNLVRNMFDGPPFYKPSTKEHSLFFQRLSPAYLKYILSKAEGGSPSLKAHFFTAAIWLRLWEQLLKWPLTAFSRSLGIGVFNLQNRVLDSGFPHDSKSEEMLFEFQQFREHSGQFSYTVYRDKGSFNDDRQTEFAAELAEHFERFNRSDFETLKKEFKLVVGKAVNLASLIARSKEHFIVCISTDATGKVLHGFPFDKAWMIAKHQKEGGEVDLVISPALIQYGNQEGEDYRVPKILCRAEVIQR